MNEIFEPPDWFNSEYSLLLNLPFEGNYIKENTNINFGNEQHNDIFNQHFKFIANEKIFDFKDNFEPRDIIIKRINDTKNKKINYAKNNKSSQSVIDGIETKFNNKIHNIDNTTIAYTFKIHPNNKQKNILFRWNDENLKLYNLCVDIHNEDNHYFEKGHMKAKLDIFDLFENLISPYDTRTFTIKQFCSNLKSAKTNYKNGNIKHFLMKHKILPNCFNLYIPKTSINEKTVFPSHLGIIKGIQEFFVDNNINIDQIGDSFIRYNRIYDEFYLIVPYYKNKTILNNKNKVVAIDPGEAVAFSYFSQEGFGFLGKDIRKKILNEQQKIKKLQSALNKKTNRNGNKLKNIKSVEKKISIYFLNIKNYVKELHNKVALFLVRNYDTILIPKFETQKMISTKDRINYKLEINDNIDENQLLEQLKNKSLAEINEILNLFTNDNNDNNGNDNNIDREKKIIKRKCDERIEKIKLSNISNKEKTDLIKMTNELIKLEKMGNDFSKSLFLKKKKCENEIKKCENDSYEMNLKQIDALHKETIEKINEEIKKSILTLGISENEAELYINANMKNIKEKERVCGINNNSNKLKEMLENKKNKSEKEKEIEEEKIKVKQERNNKLKKIFEIIEKNYGEKILKHYKKEITRKSKLNKRVKFVLQMLSHYKFRQHLEKKSIEYGCKMITVTEEYTSKTCTNCGKIENKFNKRTKECSNCKYKINRDINGARNILIKNLDMIINNYISENY